VKPYHPSGKISIFLLPIAVVVTIGSSTVLGYIAYLLWLSIDKWHSLLSSLSNEFIDGLIGFIDEFFPISSIFVIIGLIITYLLLFLAISASSAGLRWSKVRNYTVLFIFGFLTAFIFQSVGYYNHFMEFQKTPVQIEETGQYLAQNFWGYLQYEWIKDALGFWLPLVFNFSIFQYLAIGAVFEDNGKEPFCEESNSWYGKEQLLGFVNSADIPRLDDILNTDRYHEIDFAIDPADLPLKDRVGQLAIYIREIDRGESKTVLLEVKKVAEALDYEDSEPIKLNNYRSGTISRENYHQIQSAVSALA
jgi:hypothetical protein